MDELTIGFKIIIAGVLAVLPLVVWIGDKIDTGLDPDDPQNWCD